MVTKLEISSNTPQSPETQQIIESTLTGENALKEQITTVSKTKSELSDFSKFFDKLKNAWDEIKEGNISKAISTLFGTNQQKSQQTSSTTKIARVGNGKSHEIDHINIIAPSESKEIWNNLKGKEKPDLEPFACAMKAYEAEKSAGHLKNTKYLTVVDFTKNQLTSNRLFVIDMETNTVEHAEKCGHGSGSGNAEWATSFGNVSGSHKSSLGAYITADHSRSNTKGTWHSNFGEGIEESNNKSKNRGIALLHPVKSLTYASGKPTSDGCITIPGSQKKVDKILNKIEGGSLVFAYAKSKDYFAQSKYFQQNTDGSIAA